MLDRRLITGQPELIREHLRRRNADDSLLEAVDEVARLSAERSALIKEGDDLRSQRNQLSKQVGQLFREGRREEAEAIRARVKAGNERTAVIEARQKQVQERQDELLLTIPNLLHADVPAGATDDDNEVLRQWGEPREFDFTPEAHVEVGERLGILDMERSGRVFGARFWVLRGLGARLERALINFFLDLHVGEHGYTEVMVPAIVRRPVLVGTGQLPKFEEDLFKLDGQVNGEDAYLIPTAEVPVTNLHRDEILDEAQLPIKYACFTPCFRSEAGSAGRDVRGLIRVHQFHKVELVWVTTPEQSEACHAELLRHAEVAMQRLGLPYQVVLLCGGDTGFSAHKCYDIEVWLPSQERYREISSCSTFHDFQARRMALRYRPATEGNKKAKARPAHTLNGSGLAVGRTLVAILENYQQADGSVVVPTALRPYLGGVEVLVPPDTP